MTKEIIFPKENQNAVSTLMRKYCSNYEYIAGSKDGEVYEVTFTSPEYYQYFFNDFKNLGGQH